MTQTTKTQLELVIKSAMHCGITIKQAAKQTVNLKSDDPKANPDDMLLLGVRNLVESIPKIKTNEPIRESNLSCAYVNSLLNPVFSSPDKDKLLIWGNIQVSNNNTMQPDFSVSKLIHSYFHGPSVVGDIKGEDSKGDTHDCLVDLICSGMISSSSINQNKYNGVVGVHIVGLQVAFYIITLMANGMRVMLEICSLTLPRDFTEMRSYIANNMENVLP